MTHLTRIVSVISLFVIIGVAQEAFAEGLFIRTPIAPTTTSPLLRSGLQLTAPTPLAPTLNTTLLPIAIQPSLTIAPVATQIASTITCTKTVQQNNCIVFACNDGTSFNTCSLNADAPLPGSVATDGPKITSFQPQEGNAGTIVRVYFTKGKKNFSGLDSIEIGGTPVKLITMTNVPGSSADFYLEFALPQNAVTGKIAFKKPGMFNTVLSDQVFNVIPWQDAPVISSIKPLAGFAGQEVTIELFMGKKTFSGIDSVQVGGVNAKITQQTNVPSKKPNARSITFIVPPTAKTGKITLKKPSLFATVYSKDLFTVVPAQNSPTILSFSPPSAKVGETVIVKLVAGMKAFSGLDEAWIGGKKAEIVSLSSNSSGIRLLTIKVPAGATTGKIILKKPSLFDDAHSVANLVVIK